MPASKNEGNANCEEFVQLLGMMGLNLCDLPTADHTHIRIYICMYIYMYMCLQTARGKYAHMYIYVAAHIFMHILHAA